MIDRWTGPAPTRHSDFLRGPVFLRAPCRDFALLSCFVAKSQDRDAACVRRVETRNRLAQRRPADLTRHGLVGLKCRPQRSIGSDQSKTMFHLIVIRSDV